jgi:glycosyltransferase involved in cell wall biosynthesis
MAVYNGEKYLKESIESILNQSYKNFEFIVVNDASIDSTNKIINSFEDDRIILISNINNIGLTKSLNLGLKHARGKYIARMDADDISFPDRLEKQLNHMLSNDDVALLGTQASIIDEYGDSIFSPPLWEKPVTHAEIKWFTNFTNPLIHSSIMIKKDIIVDIFGGYDNNYRTNQDFELWVRIIPLYRCENMHERLLAFRLHDESISMHYDSDSMKRAFLLRKQYIENYIGKNHADKFAYLWSKLNTETRKCTSSQFYTLYSEIQEMYSSFLKLHCKGTQIDRIAQYRDYFILKISYSITRYSYTLAFKIYGIIFRRNPTIVVKFLVKNILKQISMKVKVKYFNKFISNHINDINIL